MKFIFKACSALLIMPEFLVTGKATCADLKYQRAIIYSLLETKKLGQ